MTTPPTVIELNTLERGEAYQPPPQQPVSWCGRQIQLLPAYLSGLACLFALGALAYGVERKNWVTVGLCAFVAIAVAVVTYCYLRNIPVRTMQQSAEDIQHTYQRLTKRIQDLEKVNAESKKSIEKLEEVVKGAGEERQRLEATVGKTQADLKQANQKLQETFDGLHNISNQFHDGITDLARKVIKLSDGNMELKKNVSEIASAIEKTDQLVIKGGEGSRIVRENNQQTESKLQAYKKLLEQLGTIVDAILSDYEAHKASEKEFDDMRAQNAAMQKQIDQLKGDIVELEQTKATFLELQKLSENLSNPTIVNKLGELLKT